MFDTEVVLADEEYVAYFRACLDTPFGQDYPDAAAFVRDEQQRFFDARARLLSAGARNLDAAVAADRAAARVAAERAWALASFARNRPAAMFDRAQGEVGAASAASRAARPDGLAEVSEWAVDEAAATLSVSGRTASTMLLEAVTLVEQLPATLAALSRGDISPAHARLIVDYAGPVSTPEKRAAVEAAVLPRAPQQTVAALRACLKRALARIDAAAAADRLAKAVRDRHVRLDARDDGMAALTIVLAGPLGRAVHQALSEYAKACAVDENGERDPRTHQQRMTDCAADLILRPHADHPVVKVLLTLIAGVDTLTGEGPGADEPGEVDGELVPAAMVRELAYALGFLPRPAADQPDTTGPETHRDATPDTDAPTPTGIEDEDPAAPTSEAPAPAEDQDAARLAALRAEELAAAEALVSAHADMHPPAGAAPPGRTSDGRAGAEVSASVREALTRLLDIRRLIDTALAERPRIALTDQLTGALLALTDSIELRAAAASGRGLGPPPGTDAYAPTDPLHRFVKLRDRRCRFPGCRARARCCDLDHQVPHPHGPTAHDNLACLCEHHHRLSHQAPGWQLHRDEDGGLVWTLPGGLVLTTYPPAFGTDDGSTPTVTPAPRTGQQEYADLLATLRTSRPVPASTLIPF
ncbi:HNH endonuclease signature motif containing protein [Blastococcus sp. TF02A-30]|uniref:HNH endonuclease signature motif containing protein n=1 Tax=Blastococcus sp. TF02A-30 TaxID=2250580 RepID=UPI000DEB8FF0|nr:HNH endonuclease signature motif containing protein [Blastococcus sp. TF02A-30]RBY86567.1 hypothetical protein DQ241_13745 [Blastococcus sp. TF02A-30]